MANQTVRPRRDFGALETRRLEAAKLFRRGEHQAKVANRLGVSRQSVSRWCYAWKKQGHKGLKGAGRAGRLPRLDGAACRRLGAILQEGPASCGFTTHLWTLERVAWVIRKTFHIPYSVPQAWRLLGQLGWSRQRPNRKARERNEAAIRRWVRDRLPQIKKKPGV